MEGWRLEAGGWRIYILHPAFVIQGAYFSTLIGWRPECGVPQDVRCRMRISRFAFGVLEIDGVTYEHDIVIDHGEIGKRKKKASKKFRDAFGHTPLSVEENIPWRCSRLIVGTGAYGRLPIMDDVKREADRRGVKLIVLPTAEAIEVIRGARRGTNAVLHVTC
jgi:hypothetical protein